MQAVGMVNDHDGGVFPILADSVEEQEKAQIPKSKSQTNSKSQPPRLSMGTAKGMPPLGYGSLGFVWSLGFAFWSLQIRVRDEATAWRDAGRQAGPRFSSRVSGSIRPAPPSRDNATAGPETGKALPAFLRSA